MVEYWDIYDEDRNKTGKLHQRGIPLQEGDYHLVVTICTINSNNQILLTLRHPDKPWGNYWEYTGGSAVYGEDSITGAQRELSEETGIEVDNGSLIFLGTIQGQSDFVDTYLVIKDIVIEDLKLQAEEVIDAKWVDMQEFDEMGSKKLILPMAVEQFNSYKSKILEIIGDYIKENKDGL